MGKILFKKYKLIFKHHQDYTLYDICLTGSVTVDDAEAVGAGADFESKDKPPAAKIDADVVTLAVVAREKPVAPVVAAGTSVVLNKKPVLPVPVEELASLVVDVAPNKKPVPPLDD